ncbi:Uncharacterised protein [Proteus vulgaris]|nr:Uncharacterised protein [Proteus vulgaris]
MMNMKWLIKISLLINKNYNIRKIPLIFIEGIFYFSPLLIQLRSTNNLYFSDNYDDFLVIKIHFCL